MAGSSAAHIQRRQRSSSTPSHCVSIDIGKAPRIFWLIRSLEVVLACRPINRRSSNEQVPQDYDPNSADLVALPSDRDIMQDVRSHTPRVLKMPDVEMLELEGMGDQYDVDSGADSKDNDNDNDAALLLSARNIVDLADRVDHRGLARPAQQTRRTWKRRIP
jgi:hypothetical protein